MRPKLEIYIDQSCPTCDQAIRLALVVQERMSDVAVKVIDLSRIEEKRPDFVFAVPTFILNGKVFSLGNPDQATLLAQLQAELDQAV